MSEITVRTRHHGSLVAGDVALAAPLMEMAAVMARQIVARQMVGLGAAGPNKPLAPGRPGRVWVRPGAPQPAGWLFRVTEGPRAGWAVYASLAAYRKAAGAPGPGGPRRFRKTGELWDRRLVLYQASPRLVRLYFRGRHRGSGLPAARLAALVQRGSSGILEPSRAEVAELDRVWSEVMVAQVREAFGVAERGFSLRRGVASLGRRLGRRGQR